MSTLRQTSDGSVSPTQLPEVGTDSVWLEIDNPEGTPVEPIIEDYPYEQREYTGTVYYREVIPSMDIQTEPEEFDFRYRDGSGLFIIEGEIKGVKSRKIFTELNESIKNITGQRLKFINTSRKGEWSFVYSGSDRPHLVANDIKGEEVPDDIYEELSPAEMANKFNLESANVVFYCGENDEHVNVSYQNGLLNFTEDVSPEGREEVIQLYEKYAVYGDILDDIKQKV